MKHQLRLYQREAFRFLKRNGSSGFFVEMRMGKTLVMIRLLRRMRRPILVVAPGSAIGSWIDDLVDEEQPYTTLLGSRAQRLKTLATGLAFGRGWFLINKEGHRALPELANVSWGAVILDESHFIKNPKAKVTKFYTKNFRDVPYRYVLTGTPNPESRLDMVTQFIFTHGHCCGFTNYWSFEHAMTTSFDGYTKKLKKTAREAMVSFVSRNAYVLDRASAGMDVEKVIRTRYIEMPPKVRKAYDKLEKDFVLELGDVYESHLWRMSQYAALRSLCSGVLPSQEEGGGWLWDGKVRELLDLLEGELAEQQVVVWFSFIQPMRLVAANLAKEKISCTYIDGSVPMVERFERIRKFNAGGARVILVQERVGESGIKLAAADTAVYFTEPPGLVTKQQSEDRILLVEKQSILLIPFVVPNTVEHDIHKALGMKKREALTFLNEAMRRRALRGSK
jgi:SNF2 family DNA or RNA helicase